MALSLDNHVVADLSSDIHLSLDFVGTISADASSVEQCQTSSGWSECVVNTYHLCAQQQAEWWPYSVCLYKNQYPSSKYNTSIQYLECAGLNPVHPILRNQTCTRSEFPAIVQKISDICAAEANLNASALQECAVSDLGLDLLKHSMNNSNGFPTSLLGKVEPQWIVVNAPSTTSCSKEGGGWNACKAYMDKTDCLDWNHCNSDDWALHLRERVLGNSKRVL